MGNVFFSRRLVAHRDAVLTFVAVDEETGPAVYKVTMKLKL